MNYIIVDLEATCWEGHDKSRNETIEIGAVLINEHGQFLSEFESFVKPIKFPILSDFCKSLTSISQKDVDGAPYFYEAIEDFKKWFGHGETDYVICSWGFYDRKQFESDCELHHLDIEWLKPHISLKHQHGKLARQKRALGMKRALELEGLSLEGTHHRGIDDARNIAKIFVKYLGQWQLP